VTWISRSTSATSEPTRLDGCHHVRPWRDVEALAELCLDVREQPVGQKLKHRVAVEEVRGVQVVRGLARELPISPLVQLDGHDVGALCFDRRFHLIDARL